jgi:glucosylceramidase
MAKQTWESCIYTAEEERDFVKIFRSNIKNAGLGDKKITVWDHNRDLLSQRASTILTTHKLVNTSGELVSIGMKAGVVEIQCLIMLVKFTKCILIKLAFTEGCVEKFDYSKLQRWANGERYGKSMIHDFNNGTGWTDWNILLDQMEGLIM